MAELKPTYLISGDDDAKIDAWRVRVRERAETERGPGGLEAFDARACGPEALVGELATLSFNTGTRYVLVDHAEAWKAAALAPLEAALTELPPDTVLVIMVRGKPLKQLQKAIEKSDGEVRDYTAPKSWQLPKWAAERAREEGLQLDGEAAKDLVSIVGHSQQRLTREIEKLALAVHPETHLSIEDVGCLASGDAAPQAYDLADALVAGDLRATLERAEELGSHAERPGRLVFPIVRRLREVHAAARLLDAGASEAKAAEGLRMPPWLAKKTVAKAKAADRVGLERALCVFAELEVDTRGGGGLDEDTAFTLALARAAT